MACNPSKTVSGKSHGAVTADPGPAPHGPRKPESAKLGIKGAPIYGRLADTDTQDLRRTRKVPDLRVREGGREAV